MFTHQELNFIYGVMSQVDPLNMMQRTRSIRTKIESMLMDEQQAETMPNVEATKAPEASKDQPKPAEAEKTAVGTE